MRKLIFVTLLWPTLSLAATIDFTQVLHTANNEEMKTCVKNSDDGKCIEFGPMTLSDAAVTALESAFPEDKDAKKKFEQDQLARRIYKATAATLSSEDITLLKERIGRVFGPAVVGATWLILDPTEAKPNAK